MEKVLDNNGGAIILLFSNFHSVTRLQSLSLPFKPKRWGSSVRKCSVWRCKCTRWDSDVEENDVVFSTRKKKKRKWMSDKPPPSYDDEEEEEGLLEEFLHIFWVAQVMKSYGWAMPPIVISWLLACGPKAMLMVLAIPFGQSVVTLVLHKLFREPVKKPKPKRKVRKRRTLFRRTDADSDENLEGGMGYQTWVSNDDGSAAADENRQGQPQFGGWDDLEESVSAKPQMPGRSAGKTSDNGKLGMIEKRSGTPLLLRLLIAVFPFLGSWTNLL